MWGRKRIELMTTLAAIALCLTACQSRRSNSVVQFTGGNPQTGKEKISYYGCPTCHEISGVRTATGRVGPSLNHIADQTYLAGELPNTPQNMALWIQKPRDIEPHTAMPDMSVSDQDARDITAYLYSMN